MHPKSGTFSKRVLNFGSPYLKDPCISAANIFVDVGSTTHLKNALDIFLHKVHGSQ